MDPEAPPDNLTGSARRTAEILLRTVQNRAELFALEMEEEGRWVMVALVWTAAAIFFALLAITLITLTVVLLVPVDARPLLLVGFSVIHVSLAVWAAAVVKRLFKTRRPPMSETVNEIRKDLEWIQPRD